METYCCRFAHVTQDLRPEKNKNRDCYVHLFSPIRIPSPHPLMLHHLHCMRTSNVAFFSRLMSFARTCCPAQLPTHLDVCERGEGRRPPPLKAVLHSGHASYLGFSGRT